MSEQERRDATLNIVLRQIPVLWIWDNVEPVAGFPRPEDATLTTAEQRELADFLRAARATQAKFLLTSRRDERGWLGDLPRRIAVPPMPYGERVQLAAALAEKHGRRIVGAERALWQPLLWYSQGNPLAITVLVGQALRDNLTTEEQMWAFTDKLQAGEAAFEDEQSEGRSKALGASLSYGFAHAFTEDERKVLALLHLFQGFVDVDALHIMGKPNADWCLPEVRGLTREAGIALLDRAADVGLLTAHGEGYYSIHPALPWYFKGMFESFYPHPPVPSPAAAGEGSEVRATRAYVEAIGELGNYYHRQY